MSSLYYIPIPIGPRRELRILRDMGAGGVYSPFVVDKIRRRVGSCKDPRSRRDPDLVVDWSARPMGLDPGSPWVRPWGFWGLGYPDPEAPLGAQNPHFGPKWGFWGYPQKPQNRVKNGVKMGQARVLLSSFGPFFAKICL